MERCKKHTELFFKWLQLDVYICSSCHIVGSVVALTPSSSSCLTLCTLMNFGLSKTRFGLYVATSIILLVESKLQLLHSRPSYSPQKPRWRFPQACSRPMPSIRHAL